MSDRAVARGERVHLRRPRASDTEAFVAAARGSRELHGDWISAPSDPEAFAAYLRRCRSRTVESLLVVRTEDEAFAGVFTMSQIFYGWLRGAYLGYYAFAPLAGHGYMREGLGLVLRHAFGPLGLHRLEANVQPVNVASIALVRGAGFRLEGYSPRYLFIAGAWRDHERWAITVEDLEEPAPGP